MDFEQAVESVVSAQRCGACDVRFTTPILSVCLAATAWRQPAMLNVTFAGAAGRYADVIGLAEALRRQLPVHADGRLNGQTYSPLEWLVVHDHIRRCNQRIGSVIDSQLTQTQHANVGRAITRAVGELHDNVPSHACGMGFSAAQVFKQLRKPVVRFAIADNGKGFYANARKGNGTITDDLSAIYWAFERGTTSWRPPDPWAQRGMGEPEHGAGNEPGDNHAGEGLADLRELVDRAEGAMWVASGATQLLYKGQRWQNVTNPSFSWAGVAIELEIPLDGRPKARNLKVPTGVNDLL